MIIHNTTSMHITEALVKVHEKYGGNVYADKFKGLGGKKYSVHLRVRDSKGSGARRSINGRRSVSACWHAVGTFIDALNKDAYVSSAAVSGMIVPGDTWRDWPVGEFNYYSELCECES